jgi:hypothetical protein
MESMVIRVDSESGPGSKVKFTDFHPSWAKSAVVHQQPRLHILLSKETEPASFKIALQTTGNVYQIVFLKSHAWHFRET